jgi:hypothetical protein
MPPDADSHLTGRSAGVMIEVAAVNLRIGNGHNAASRGADRTDWTFTAGIWRETEERVESPGRECRAGGRDDPCRSIE